MDLPRTGQRVTGNGEALDVREVVDGNVNRETMHVPCRKAGLQRRTVREVLVQSQEQGEGF